MEPRRMYASERDGLFKLAMALEFVVRGRDALKARLKEIPGGARDMAMIDKVLTKTLNALLDTAPEDHRRSLRRNLDGVSYTIGAAMPGTQTHNDDFGVWLSYSTLNTMITALEDHCLMLRQGRRGTAEMPAAERFGRVLHERQGCTRWRVQV